MNVQTAKTAPLAASVPVDIDLLRTFMAIVETGSFSKAAEKVFRTPSAVSMQMKKMEELLGTSVFVRDSRSVEVTADGELLTGYARRILALSNEMMARFITPQMEGAITLGIPDDYAEKVIPDILKRFSETHPNVQLNVVMDSTFKLLARFEAGDLDVMLYTGRTDTADPKSIVVLEEELVWAGLKGGCAHERSPLPLSMWEEGCAWRAAAVAALDKAGRSWRTAYMTSHVQAQRAAMASDLAIGPFPKAFVEAPLTILGEKEGLPPLGSYQIRMRIKDNPGCCSQALADHVIASFDGL